MCNNISFHLRVSLMSVRESMTTFNYAYTCLYKCERWLCITFWIFFWKHSYSSNHRGFSFLFANFVSRSNGTTAKMAMLGYFESKCQNVCLPSLSVLRGAKAKWSVRKMSLTRDPTDVYDKQYWPWWGSPF
jgi:hypothetical protein